MRKLSLNVFKRFGRSNNDAKKDDTKQSDLSHSTPNLLGSITSSRHVARQRLRKRVSGATESFGSFPVYNNESPAFSGQVYPAHASHSSPMINDASRHRLVEQFTDYEPDDPDMTFEFVDRPHPPFSHAADVMPSREQASISGSSMLSDASPSYSHSVTASPMDRRRSSRSSANSSRSPRMPYTPTPIPAGSLLERNTLPRSAASSRKHSRPRSSPTSPQEAPRSPLIPTTSPHLPPAQESKHKIGPSTYYIIPGGMRVIFRDEAGNEITRVGDFSSPNPRKRIAPIVIQDEDGKVLYKSPEESVTDDGFERTVTPTEGDTSSTEPCPHCHHSRRSRHHRSRARRPRSSDEDSQNHSRIVYPPYEKPNIILIDGYGRLVPIRGEAPAPVGNVHSG